MSGNVGAGGCEASPGAAMFAGGIDQESEGQESRNESLEPTPQGHKHLGFKV